MSQYNYKYTFKIEEEPIELESLMKSLNDIGSNKNVYIYCYDSFTAELTVDIAYLLDEEYTLFHPLSLRFPNSLFILSVGKSEFDEINSKIYYQNGQRAEMREWLINSQFCKKMLDYRGKMPSAIWSSKWVDAYLVDDYGRYDSVAPIYGLRDKNNRLISKIDSAILEKIKASAGSEKEVIAVLLSLNLFSDEKPFESETEYFDYIMGDDSARNLLLNLIPPGFKEEYVNLLHQICSINGTYFGLNSNTDNIRRQKNPAARKEPDLKQIFNKFQSNTFTEQCYYWRWDYLQRLISKLLEGLLGRKVDVKVLREDYCYWSVQLSTPLTGNEINYLFDILGAEASIKDEALRLWDKEEDCVFISLPQDLCDLLLSKVLPFALKASIADEDGVCLIGQPKGEV